ncbi:MAG: hypothetical protein IJT49_09315 [Clostridia bacterium]|nr:hypothetical protein [Clostridia bacterium]
MSREFDIKDILTEAASRDFSEIINTPWTPSDSHEKFINKLIRKTDKHGFVSPGLLKGLTAAAVILLLFGICMAIRPIREPAAAFFGNMFGASVGANTEKTTDTELQGTDAVTEKSGIVTEETTNMSEQTETEYTRKTDEDWIDVLVEAIASGDNSDKRWDLLHEYGEVAFDHLVKRYFNGEKDTKVKAVISVFVSETLKDEVSACESFPRQYFPDRTELKTDAHSTWLSSFKSKAQIYVKKTVKEDALKELPTVCRFVSLVGYESYRFDPNRNSVGECIDRLIEVYTTEVFDNLTKERKNETIEYCAKNYFTETDRTRRVFMSWLVFCAVGRWEMTDLVGYDLVITFYRYGDSSYISGGSNGFMYHPDIVEPIIEKYADAAKKKAETLYREETEHDFPGTYVLLSALGFDGYKPEPFDIAYRSRNAIKAAAQLYQAVTYGWVPDELVESCLPVEDYMREELTSYTKDDVSQYCPIEDFYGYFEKYMDKAIIDSACKEQNAWFTIKSGRVYMFDGGPQSSLSIDHSSAKLMSQNGDTYVITADVHFPNAMMGFTRNLTFEVKEYEDGVRLTGGVFAEKLLSPCTSASVAVSRVLGSYCVLCEGQFEYNNICYVLSYGGPYDSIDQVPKEYRDRVNADAEFPVYLTVSEEKDFALLKNSTTEEIYNELTRAYGAYDGDMAVYPKYAKTKTTPAFEHGFTYVFDAEGNTGGEFITTYDVLLAMNVIDVSDDVITLSLDFIREENGVKNNVTYTFEVRTNILTGNDINEYYTYVSKVIGGTFLTDILLAD